MHKKMKVLIAFLSILTFDYLYSAEKKEKQSVEPKEKDSLQLTPEEAKQFAEIVGDDINGFTDDRSRFGLIVETMNPKLIQKAIELGADVNAEDIREGIKTPLRWAIFSSRTRFDPEKIKSIIQMLLRAGANIYEQSKRVSVPLLHLVIIKRWDFPNEAVELLLQKRADPNEKDNIHGETAVFYAMKLACDPGWSTPSPLIELLLKYGANPLLRDSKGRTILDLCNKSIHENARNYIATIYKAYEEAEKNKAKWIPAPPVGLAPRPKGEPPAYKSPSYEVTDPSCPPPPYGEQSYE